MANSNLLARYLLQLLCIASITSGPTQMDYSLLEPSLRDIPHLHILLRHNHFQEDATNGNVLWFMQLANMPHCLHSYDEQQSLLTDDANLFELNIRDSIVMVISLAQLISSSGAGEMMRRSGVVFYILADHLEELTVEQQLQLELSCQQQWLKHKAYNHYILTDTFIWIYDPFAQSIRNDSFGRLLVYQGGEALPQLLFHNMRGYPLRVQIFKSVYSRPELDPSTGLLRSITGVDWKVAKILSERLNYSMLLQEPDKNYFGERSANGSYNGAIGSILNDDLDICLTGFFVKDYLVQEYMDFTVTVYDDQLCIYVPKAKRIPQSILPIFAVGYEIWLGFVLMAFICALIWFMLRLINLQLSIIRINRLHLWQQALAILVDTWVVWVRVNLTHLPVSYAERIFLASLCLVSVIFGAIFESSLATVYIHPLHYKDIITLQDLDDSGLKVVYKYTSMADDLFFSETSPLYASLNKKLVWNRDLNADVTSEVATIGGKAGVSRYSSLTMESASFLLMQRIWVVPECPKYYTMSYVMPSNAPWEEAINAQLLRLLNAGLIHKWILDQKYRVTIRLRTPMSLADDDGNRVVRVLTINDLQLAFYVVIGGTLLALLGFIAEHALARLCLTRHRIVH